MTERDNVEKDEKKKKCLFNVSTRVRDSRANIYIYIDEKWKYKYVATCRAYIIRATLQALAGLYTVDISRYGIVVGDFSYFQ